MTKATSKIRRLNGAMAPDVVVVGSVAVDVLHTPTVEGKVVLGGSAFHFSNAASRFASVGMVGAVGEDYPFEQAEFLRRRGVGFHGVEVKPGQTFLWEGRYHEGFRTRETIRTELGVFEHFSPNLPDSYRHPKILFLAAIEPRLQLDVLKQVKRPKLVAIDTFKLWIDIARQDFLKVLKQVDLLFVDEFEARWLTEASSLTAAAKQLRTMGPKWVIVKKGEHGSFLLGPGGMHMAQTYPVQEVVDPTGAGDSYAGALLGYLAACPTVNDVNMRRGMQWASVVGSFYVEGFGPDGLKDRSRADLIKRHDELAAMTRVP
ncbi:MAG: sugar kinase [bacterium]|nr:sugar kinase [bacterium]MBK8130297.1 sugar kinase [bacterium]